MPRAPDDREGITVCCGVDVVGATVDGFLQRDGCDVTNVPVSRGLEQAGSERKVGDTQY